MVATARQVVTGQRHYLSVHLCPRYSEMHTSRTPGVPAVTYHHSVQTCPSEAHRIVGVSPVCIIASA
jgi:hypothetical protein